MKRYTKKAAIELSTTAIVSLILAFVFLGLVIGFTRGIFEQGTGTMDEFWASVDLTEKASPDREIVTLNEVNIKRGKSIPFGLRLYNTESQSLTNAIPIITKCVGTSGEDIIDMQQDPGLTNSDKIVFSTIPFTLEPGQEYGFEGSIKVGVDVEPDSYVCRIVIYKEESSDQQVATGFVTNIRVNVNV